MSRSEIIEKLKKYFSVKELTCNHVYNKFGENAWQFFSTELLHILLVVREDILQVPMTINNGANFTQRGLRCNICQLVKSKTDKNQLYMSSHCLGEGVDFDAKGLTAEEARKKINEKQGLLPYPIRLEKDVNWVHIDVYGKENKVQYFAA